MSTLGSRQSAISSRQSAYWVLPTADCLPFVVLPAQQARSFLAIEKASVAAEIASHRYIRKVLTFKIERRRLHRRIWGDNVKHLVPLEAGRERKQARARGGAKASVAP